MGGGGEGGYVIPSVAFQTKLDQGWDQEESSLLHTKHLGYRFNKVPQNIH